MEENENTWFNPGKKTMWFIGIIIFFIIAGFFINKCGGSGLISSCNHKIKVSTCDSSTTEDNALIKYDLLCNQYNYQRGVLIEKFDSIALLLREKKDLFETVNSLNAQLEECQKKKVASRKPADVPEKKKEVTVEKPAEFKKAETTPNSRTENLSLAGDQYKGLYGGTHGVTISEGSRLIYFISDEELKSGEGKMNIPAPLLNESDPSKEFYWDREKKLWIYESNTLITVSRLLDDTPVTWCVYIGKNEQWGYEMYSPHEIFKTGSASIAAAISNKEVVANEFGGYAYASKIQFEKR
jgi:hypothetical protein